MGDAVFTPLYEVLRRRGVRFEFFQRVRDIQASADGKTVERIRIGVQATLKPGQRDYDPLFDVKGLPCWPSTPRYDQLEQGDAIRERRIDLEDYCADRPDVDEHTLERGRDFDVAVLGISVGALPDICSDLIEEEHALEAHGGQRAHRAHAGVSALVLQNYARARLETGWSARPLLGRQYTLHLG